MKRFRHEQELKRDPAYANFFDDNHSGRGDGGFDYAAASEYEREQMMKDPTVLRGLETMNLAIKDKDFRKTLDSKTQKAIQDRIDSGEGIQGISNFDEQEFYKNFAAKYSKHDAGIKNHNSANDTGQVYFKQGSALRDNYAADFATKSDLDKFQAPESQQTESNIIPRPGSSSTSIHSHMQSPQYDIDIFSTQPVTADGDQGEPFSAGNREMQQAEAAGNFLEKYKLNLKEGLRLTPTLR